MILFRRLSRNEVRMNQYILWKLYHINIYDTIESIRRMSLTMLAIILKVMVHKPKTSTPKSLSKKRCRLILVSYLLTVWMKRKFSPVLLALTYFCVDWWTWRMVWEEGVIFVIWWTSIFYPNICCVNMMFTGNYLDTSSLALLLFNFHLYTWDVLRYWYFLFM